MKDVLSHHKGLFIFTAVTLMLGACYGFFVGGSVGAALSVLFLMIVLSALEVSLSFDNAVVNAKVLSGMDEIWQKRFLTWGMLIAVFGLRIVFPVLIVSVVSGLGMLEALMLAINDQEKYSSILEESHIVIAGFGGAFLFLVGFEFFFDAEKDVHWVKVIEEKLSKLGERQSVGIVLTLLITYFLYNYIPDGKNIEFLIASIMGIITHEIVKLFGDLIGAEDNSATTSVAKTGLASFLYLEVLDASFSLDGVLGALVISKDIFIIAGGLAIGAMAVRSITIQLVKSGTLNEYKYLEHSAFYAILTLAAIMFASTLIHIPEIITGLLSIIIIVCGLWSSIKHNRMRK